MENTAKSSCNYCCMQSTMGLQCSANSQTAACVDGSMVAMSTSNRNMTRCMNISMSVYDTPYEYTLCLQFHVSADICKMRNCESMQSTTYKMRKHFAVDCVGISCWLILHFHSHFTRCRFSAAVRLVFTLGDLFLYRRNFLALFSVYFS